MQIHGSSDAGKTTYSSSSDTAVFEFLEGGSWGFGSLDELEFALRAIDALGFGSGRHDEYLLDLTQLDARDRISTSMVYGLSRWEKEE